jgi:predicted phage baseplate assembly protein
VSLELPRLDDLTLDELRTAARDRIVAASDRQWTLHAPVDPGVTLTELFAALLEERLFWMDQPDDARSRRLLALLDDEPGDAAPRPASCARTVLELTAGGVGVVPAAAGRVFKLRDAAPRSGVRLRTLAATVVLPFEPVTAPAKPRGRPAGAAPPPLQVVTGPVGEGIDRTAELLAGRGVELVPAGATEATIDIRFRASGALEADAAAAKRPPRIESINPALASVVGAAAAAARPDEFGVLFELDELSAADPRRPPTYALLPDEVRDAVDPPAGLTWEYKGRTRFVRFASVADGTGGFRRSGVVRLPVPTETEPWVEEGGWFTLRVTVRNPRYSTPPRLRRVVPNAVPAEHRYPATDPGGRLAWGEQLRAWKPLAGNELALPRESDPPLSDRARLRLPERGGRTHEWRAEADLTEFGPADRVFVVDRENRRLVFGDGRTGRVPRPDVGRLADLVVAVDVGGGKGGNVGAGLDWVTDDGGPALDARNPVPGLGGTEEESVDEALRRAAADQVRATRLCTRSDVEDLARETPGVAVARAVVVPDSHPDSPCRPVPGSVTVYVVPASPPLGPDDPPPTTALVPDPAVLRAVNEWLQCRRLIGQEVHVRPPRYAAVRVRVTLAAPATDEVRKAVRRALWTFLHPRFGGDDRSGWPAGGPVWPSTLLRVVRDAAGPDVTVEAVAIAVGANAPDGCQPTELGRGVLPDLVEVTVDAARRDGR